MNIAKSWVDIVVKAGLAFAIGLAGWGLKEIASLKDRTTGLEAHDTVIESRQDRGDLALAQALNEMRSFERDGTPGLKAHDVMDQQRDLELRNRISRSEATLDKLTTLTEKWAVAANDIAWIKAELQKRKVTP